MGKLNGKVVVCNGAGRRGGLGAGILERFAREGCRLVVSDLGTPDGALSADNIGTSAGMQEVAAGLEALGAEVEAIACDVRREEQVATLIDRTVERFGRIDVFIHNAGVGYIMKPLPELDVADWQLVLDVNLTGAFLCTRVVARQMIRQGEGGRIIHIASQASKSGFRHMAPYVASKHGLIGLTRTAALDLGGHGITVNAVCPNHVTTGLGQKQNEYFARLRGLTVEQYRASLVERIPLGRVGVPDDTAAACVFLASDDASFVTGEALNVSGGEEMH